MTTSHPTDSAVTLPRSDALPGAATAVPGTSPPLPHLRGGGEAQASAEPRTWTLPLPAGLKLLSLNDRLHWSEKNRRAAELKKAAWAMAISRRVPHLGRISVVVEYQPPDRRHRDADNIPAASGKHAIDGLVAAQVVPDDESPRYVADIRYRIGPVHPHGRLVLHITEAEPVGT